MDSLGFLVALGEEVKNVAFFKLLTDQRATLDRIIKRYVKPG